MGTLTLFDEVMISLYSFIACTLVVATAIAYDEDFWKTRDLTPKFNRYGAWASVILPVLIFLWLHWL